MTSVTGVPIFSITGLLHIAGPGMVGLLVLLNIHMRSLLKLAVAEPRVPLSSDLDAHLLTNDSLLARAAVLSVVLLGPLPAAVAADILLNAGNTQPHWIVWLWLVLLLPLGWRLAVVSADLIRVGLRNDEAKRMHELGPKRSAPS